MKALGAEIAHLHGYKNLGYYEPTEQELQDFTNGAVYFFLFNSPLPTNMPEAFALGYTLALNGKITKNDL